MRKRLRTVVRNLGRCLSLVLAGLLASVFAAPGGAQMAEDPRQVRARAALMEEVESELQAFGRRLGSAHPDPAVLKAMGIVKRHRFVPEKYQSQAYANHPLPIGHGQTISQPFIVGIMSQLLRVAIGDKVLEIGTGSGYQAAVLAAMGVSVYSIEIIRPLAESARQRLQEEGYGERVRVSIGDGYFGWEEEAPFEAIIVTAAADHIPPPLIAQLKKGGRMVIPVGGRFTVQQLVLLTKDSKGEVTTRQLMPVRFVPLTRGQ
jgi:protein-L-isoaspartate(D-aspartate) O-methyltransferase